MSLFSDWLDAKETERQAIERRREIEDQLSAMYGVQETDEGSKTIDNGEYKVKIVSRLNRKVDADLVQEIAAEHDLTAELSTLFRWSAEINKKAWDQAGIRVAPLAQAITVKPGRPSYSIERVEE